jgi:ribonuclease T1
MRIHTKSLRAALTVIATVTLGLTASPIAGATTYAVPATTSYAVPSAVTALPNCALSTLPSQAADTLRLIHSGGPFPYSQDGVVFQNREGLLPSASTGYYHEYTVKTPGSSDRGARRLIGGGSPVTNPQYVYYTGDHYASFCKVTS